MSKILTGKVTSDKMQKTVVVSVESYKKHPLYEKKYTISKKYFVDDPQDQYKIDDTLSITQTRPMSKKKSFKVVKKIG